MGAKARQGPHQAAQKSTKTGVSDFKTSWSKLVSVTSKIELLAIIPPVYIARRGYSRLWHSFISESV
jgi:hypothetical protein